MELEEEWFRSSTLSPDRHRSRAERQLKDGETVSLMC